MKNFVYVLTMTDRNDDYNNGVFNAAFSTMAKAVEAWKKWMQDEVDDGVITRDDIVINSEGFSQTRDDRFSWTIDELEVK